MDDTTGISHHCSETIGELAAALAKAQGDFEPVRKSRTNPRFGNAYATLDDIISATRKGLSANGLAVMQLTGQYGEANDLVTMLAHSSGQWLSTRLSIIAGNIVSREGREVLTQAQAFGSALTYARRYALAALLNVAAEEDDDAETSGERGKEAAPKRQQPLTISKPADVVGDIAPEKAHWCEEHKVTFGRHEKGGETWYSHKKPDGSWCNEGKLARSFEDTSQPVLPATGEAPETPGAGKGAAQAENEALRASGGERGIGLWGDRASQRQINAINTLGQKKGKSLEDIVKELGKAPEELTEEEARNTIIAWGAR